MPIPQHKQYRLTFEDVPEYSGIEVVMTGLSVGELLNTMVMPVVPTTELTDPVTTARMVEEYRSKTMEVYETFARHLISWNVETPYKDRTEPVPPTIGGVLTQDEAFIRGCIQAWRTATQGVPAPLGQLSRNGEPSPELSIPMEPLSPNQMS